MKTPTVNTHSTETYSAAVRDAQDEVETARRVLDDARDCADTRAGDPGPVTAAKARLATAVRALDALLGSAPHKLPQKPAMTAANTAAERARKAESFVASAHQHLAAFRDELTIKTGTAEADIRDAADDAAATEKAKELVEFFTKRAATAALHADVYSAEEAAAAAEHIAAATAAI